MQDLDMAQSVRELKLRRSLVDLLSGMSGGECGQEGQGRGREAHLVAYNRYLAWKPPILMSLRTSERVLWAPCAG